MARTSIETIVAQDAEYCRNVSIKICRSFSWVTIRDDEGVQEDVFMQGDDAEGFIKAFDGLCEEAPDITFEDALRHLAKPYVENIWN